MANFGGLLGGARLEYVRGNLLDCRMSERTEADFIPQPRSMVLDGCPMFAPAYMGRKRIFQMLSLHARRFLLFAVVFLPA